MIVVRLVAGVAASAIAWAWLLFAVAYASGLGPASDGAAEVLGGLYAYGSCDGEPAGWAQLLVALLGLAAGVRAAFVRRWGGRFAALAVAVLAGWLWVVTAGGCVIRDGGGLLDALFG